MKVKLKKALKSRWPYKPQNVCNNSRMSWQEAGALWSGGIKKQYKKNFDLMADNEDNNNLGISIYLANLNPPYKNVHFCDEFWTS